MSDIKVFVYPEFSTGDDKGDGGIRRVTEAQRRHFADCGLEIVDDFNDADIIACHIMAEDYLLKITDKPIVAHSHGLYWGEYEWAKWALHVNEGCMETFRQADAITAPTEWVAQAIRRNTMRNVTVIGHGIEFEEWPLKAKQPTVLWNKTRPDPVCDPKDMQTLAELAPDVSFTSTFGEPTPNVTVTGRMRYELAKSLVQESAIYLATTRETFGIGTLEAMASGAAILGWRWAGQAEFVEHKVTGYLATPGDFEDLLVGLRYCLDNYTRMGKTARALVKKRFQWKDVICQYADLYRKVLDEFYRERPKVSVIITAYNLAEHLPKALDSVKAQTLEDWECIVVDDASPDDCWRIAQKYAKEDPRFKLIRNKENKHQAASINVGIEAAHGKYILSLDADNMLPLDATEILSNALDTKRDIHIAYGNVEFLEPDGRRWHSGWPVPFKGEWQLIRRTKEDRPSNLVPSAAMFRRSMWEALGGYRERMRNCEDPDFWTRATSYGFRAEMVTAQDTFIYLNRPDSLSRTEKFLDWTLWYPWCFKECVFPAGAILEEQPPVPSFEPVLISVIIPVGPGHERMFIDAVDSVDAQTFRLWECIIVNDTGAPLRWTPSWARVIDTGGQRGVAYARNMGIQASKASLFLPLDADDTLERDALKFMYAAQKQYGGYVYSDFYEVWKDKPVTVWQSEDYDARLLTERGCLHAVTALYPKSAWKQLGGFDETLPAWEDWDFQLGLANIGVCGTRLADPLFAYRKDTGMRREENYARFEESKQAIRAKWRAYFDREETLMGCSSCGGGGGGPAIPSQMQQYARQSPPPAEQADEYLMVEYVGGSDGLMVYRAYSGQEYHFAATATERVKYVRRDDVAFFAERADFKISAIDAPGA